MAWELTGNAGSNPATNFLGTTDNEPLSIKTNGVERLRIDAGGSVGIGTTTTPYRLSVAANFDGDGIELIGSQSPIKDVAVTLVDEVGNVGSLGLASGPNAFMTGGISPGDIVLHSVTGSVWLGTGRATATPTLRISKDGIRIGGSPADIRLGLPNAGEFIRSGEFISSQRDDAGPNKWGIDFGTNSSTRMSITNAGNVSIGTTTPETDARLEVRGGSYGITCKGDLVSLYAHNNNAPQIAVYLATNAVAGDFQGDVRVSGSVQVGGDVILTGADCAEEFDTAEAAEIEPGTVMVLDQDGALHQSQQAYDKRVAGVISGAGDYRPGLILDRRQSQDYRVPVALVGKAYCKVDAQYAPIEVGDLLTTSPTPGHAMKADDPLKAFGAVIGKALRTLEAGQGTIPILIALQ